MRNAPFVHQCRPGNTDFLDEWSTTMQTYDNKFGGRNKKVAPKDRGSPGRTPAKTTLSLGSGRPYDHAEAARVAAAERAMQPHHTAYPAAEREREKAGDETSFGRRHVGHDGKKFAAPITVNLFNSAPTWIPYRP